MNQLTATRLAGLAEPLRSRLGLLLAGTGDRVWIVSGRRSIEEQAQLRRAHCGTSWSDVWRKPANQCSPPTAIPGSSKHESGQAVDLGGDLALAERLGQALGMGTPIESEDWHFEISATAHALTGGDPGGVVTDKIGDVLDGPAGVVTDAVGSALGALVEPLLAGLRRITLVLAVLSLAGAATGLPAVADDTV